MSTLLIEGMKDHGLIVIKENTEQVNGVCPFCQTSHFYAQPDKGLWDCKHGPCMRKGNFESFLAMRMQMYTLFASKERLQPLEQNRGLRIHTFEEWGVGWNPRTEQYMLPINGTRGRKLINILRWTFGKQSMSTHGAKMGLLMPRYMHESEVLWIGEGFWDGAAVWEFLQDLNIKEDVTAVPGAGIHPKEILELCQDKVVFLPFDYDDAGEDGSSRLGEKLHGIAKEVKYLHWPRDRNLPRGYDVRDFYTGLVKNPESTPEEFRKQHTAPETHSFILHFLLPNSIHAIAPNPAQEVVEETSWQVPPTPPDPTLNAVGKPVPKRVLTRTMLIEQYRKWLQLDDEDFIDIVYGSVFANRLDINPLWIFVVAPPGMGKSEMIMSLDGANRIHAQTTLTPASLISGQRNGAAGDPSLIPKLNGKTLVLEDFTAILQMNQLAREEILSILRSAYGGEVSKAFSGVIRRYRSTFGIIAGVTPIIESASATNSLLGERFMRYGMNTYGGINSGRNVVRRALQNTTHKTEMRAALKAIAREALTREISPEEIPNLTAEQETLLVYLAEFVSKLRGIVNKDKYSGTLLSKPFQEIGTRIATQLKALALGISIFKRDTTITLDTWRLITKVARDTIPGRVEEVVRQLYLHYLAQDGATDKEWFSPLELSRWTHFPVQTVRYLLEDLEMLYVISQDTKGNSFYYGLTPSMLNLIEKANIYSLEREYHAQKVTR